MLPSACRPGLTASPMPLPLSVVAPPVENANRAAKSVPLYARMKRKAGSILGRAGLNRAGGMTLGYTKWIVKQSKRASGKKTAEPAAVESKGMQSGRRCCVQLRTISACVAPVASLVLPRFLVVWVLEALHLGFRISLS